MHLNTIDEIKDFANAFSSEDNLLLNDISTGEILELVETHLNGEDRTTYLKVKSGAKVTKAEMTKLTTRLQQILKDHA